VRRILLLIKGLGRGGAEALLASSAKWFDGEQFAFEIAYLLPYKDALVREVQEAGLPVRCLGGGGRGRWTRRLREMVRERDIDLVHAHSPHPAVGARLALGSAVRHVYTEHNVWQRYRAPTYWGNMLTFGRNDHVFAVSSEVQASMRYPVLLGYLRKPPTEVLYHGLDPEARATWGSPDGVREELGIPEDVAVVGTVGSLTPKKDHETLIRAAAELRRRVPGVRVILVGQGPLESRIRELIRDLDLERTVILAGYREDAARVAGALDVFVLSSRYEGLPISLLEAMASGRPVVATAVGGIPEVIGEGRGGVLVPPGDSQTLAAAIAGLLADARESHRLGEEGRRRAGDFDIRAAVRRQEDVYRELLP
jgi:glycosyltransferase involved in cell wall biosynthesis